MVHSESEILKILDDCCESYTFPMLDNGYVYLAVTRMTLFRSEDDWALTIEVFGFSPRSGLPDTHGHTFASRPANRSTAADYVSLEAFEDYLDLRTGDVSLYSPAAPANTHWKNWPEGGTL